jgi:hypothetical protein
MNTESLEYIEGRTHVMRGDQRVRSQGVHCIKEAIRLVHTEIKVKYLRVIWGE